jgi:hypothetical protein
MELLEGVLYLGEALRLFGRRRNRQPHREPSQISKLHEIGRLALGAFICLLILTPLAWFIWG